MAGAIAAIHELLLHKLWCWRRAASVHRWVGLVPPRGGGGRGLGRPEPPAGSAEGEDGFAAVAGEHPIGDGPGAAEQRAATGHAADGPGAVAHVDEPEVAVGHGGLLGVKRCVRVRALGVGRARGWVG